MRPSPFEEAMHRDRYHDQARRHAHERALRETRPERPSARVRLGGLIQSRSPQGRRWSFTAILAGAAAAAIAIAVAVVGQS